MIARESSGKIVELVLVHELEQQPASHLVAGDVGHDVAVDHVLQPDVGHDELDQLVVELAPPHQLGDGNAQALLVDLGCAGRVARPADIGAGA